MIGIVIKIGILLLATESSRQNKRRKTQAKVLEGEIAAKDAEINGIKQRLDSMPGRTKQLLRKMDKEGRAEVAKWKTELEKVNESMRPRIGVLEREVARMRGLDATKIQRRVRELEGIHLAMQTKIARRDELIKELENKLARRQTQPTMAAAGSSA